MYFPSRRYFRKVRCIANEGRDHCLGRATAKSTNVSPVRSCAHFVKAIRHCKFSPIPSAHPMYSRKPTTLARRTEWRNMSANSQAAYTKRYQRTTPRVVMITECSMADNVAGIYPNVDFIRPCNLCPHMKRNNAPEDFALARNDGIRNNH